MANICVVALIGLPASGKTTFCKLLSTSDSLPFTILHINYDKLLSAKPDCNVSYKQQRINILNDLQTLVHAIKCNKEIPINLFEFDCTDLNKICRKDRLVILCDDNHYYRSMRYKLYQISRQLNLSYGQIYMECCTDLALKRNNARSEDEQVPSGVFQRMAECIEIPKPDVYDWELNTLHVIFSEVNKQFISTQVTSFLLGLFEKPLQNIPLNDEEKLLTHTSQAHSLDIAMRKRIGIFLKSQQNIDRQQTALILNEKKNMLLKEFQDSKNVGKTELVEEITIKFEEFLERFKRM